jgi:signal peptidase II
MDISSINEMKKGNINFKKEKINPDKSEYQKIRRKIYFFFIVALVIFIIDRYVKLISETREGCAWIFCLSRTTNSGAAFSLFSGFSFIVILAIVVALIVLFLTAFFYIKTRWNIDDNGKGHPGLIGFATPLIFAGTLSNMLDRILLGHVVDYLSIGLPVLNLTTFNIADLANTAGIILLIIFLFKKK